MKAILCVRWLLFATFLSFFFVLPPAILWGKSGAAVGGALYLMFLGCICHRGGSRIFRRMDAKVLTRAQAPAVHHLVREYCRRVGVAVPTLGIIESQHRNIATFGFFERHTYLVFTRGLLGLSRKSLHAIIGRQICSLRFRNYSNETWLSQLLSIVEPLVSHRTGRDYSVKLFLVQSILYPLLLIPFYLLYLRRDPEKLDSLAVKVTREPEGLASGLRVVSVSVDKIPFQVALSLRHLFLIAPSPRDPLARMLFQNETLIARIKWLEKEFVLGKPRLGQVP